MEQSWNSCIPVFQSDNLNRTMSMGGPCASFEPDYAAWSTLDQVWSILPASQLLPIECSRYSCFCSGALILIILFIYYAKSVTFKTNHHQHKASKLASNCVPWASELFGKHQSFQKLSFSWNAIQFLWTRGTTPNLVNEHAPRINAFYQISRLLVHILKNGSSVPHSQRLTHYICIGFPS